jgi:hypothetical protein
MFIRVRRKEDLLASSSVLILMGRGQWVTGEVRQNVHAGDDMGVEH